MTWKFSVQDASKRLFEERLYQQAADEMRRGELRNGIWARAFAEAKGVEGHAQAIYILYRVQAIKDEALLHTADEAWIRNLHKEFGERTTGYDSSAPFDTNPWKSRGRCRLNKIVWWAIAGAGVIFGASSVIHLIALFFFEAIQ
jgi:hypothetical protein